MTGISGTRYKIQYTFLRRHRLLGECFLNLIGSVAEAFDRCHAASAVRDRIGEAYTIVRMPVAAIELYVVQRFLSDAQCAALIELIDTDRVSSQVVGDEPASTFRTSETCYLSPAIPPVAAIEAALHQLTGIDPALGEALQGQRYAVGQEFKPHFDFFQTGQEYWQEQVVMGGQRTWTAMMFLNEPEAGGKTNFPRAKVAVTPRTGNLLVWNNMDDTGVPNDATLHQGMPVERGLKYILTKWYRERP